MSAKLPNVTRSGNCQSFRSKAGQIIGGIICDGLLGAVDEEVDFPGRETGELNVEIDFDQVLEMTRSRSKSQTACSGRRLSAMTTARFSESLRPVTVTVGTLIMWRRFAASHRP